MSDRPQTSLASTLQALSRALSALGPDATALHRDPRLDELITALPKLTEADIDIDGVCPICLVSFRVHLAEEEMALAMESPAHASEDLGVTRLEQTCRHTFCRKDISKWIRQSRNSCPTCRRPLLDPLPEQGEGTENTEQPPPIDVDATAQMADEVIRDVLQSLGPVDVNADPEQLDSMRRLLETLLPSIPQPATSNSNSEGDTENLDRSRFGMYS